MKKSFLLAALFLGIASAVNAESAIGARLTNGAEVSYQTNAFGNRTEIDLGWSLENERIRVAVVYQFVQPIQSGFNWYYGVGAGADLDNGLYIGILGNLGAEYNFSRAPFQISLDWRPALNLIPATDFYAANFGLGIRYKF